MTRRSSTLIPVLGLLVAVTVAMPAAASDPLPTPDTYLAQHGNGLSSGNSSQPADRLPTPDTYLAQLGSDRDHTSVNATTGSPLGEPPVASPVGSNDGFDWGDALIGALIASLMLITLAAARSVARHRGVTAESRA